MEIWQPLGFSEDASQEFRGLSDGMPHWLEQSFWDWVTQRFQVTVYRTDFTGSRYAEQGFNIALLRKVERVCRFSVPYTSDHLAEGMRTLRQHSTAARNELRLADFLLSEVSTDADPDRLDLLLLEGGSAWTIGTRAGRPGLTRRVPEGVQLAAEEVMQSGGHAGARLAEAWTAAFGIDPDPSKAYSLAIKAIEDASKPVISPKDEVATLGRINGTLKAAGDWGLPFQRTAPDATPSMVLLAVQKMLWAGQADRHGGDPDPTLVISQQAAETAVVFAVPIVHAYASGAVTRGESTPSK